MSGYRLVKIFIESVPYSSSRRISTETLLPDKNSGCAFLARGERGTDSMKQKNPEQLFSGKKKQV
jgi:hypothetical protein